MKTAIIRGGTPLIGEVAVSGSKNAALPIIFATAVTRGVSRIHGVPHIGDIAVALDILSRHSDYMANMIRTALRHDGDLRHDFG